MPTISLRTLADVVAGGCTTVFSRCNENPAPFVAHRAAAVEGIEYESFFVTDLFVGHVSEWERRASRPSGDLIKNGLRFSMSEGRRLALDPLYPTQTVALQVMNKSDRALPFAVDLVEELRGHREHILSGSAMIDMDELLANKIGDNVYAIGEFVYTVIADGSSNEPLAGYRWSFLASKGGWNAFRASRNSDRGVRKATLTGKRSNLIATHCHGCGGTLCIDTEISDELEATRAERDRLATDLAAAREMLAER